MNLDTIIKRIQALPPYKYVRKWAMRTTLPGFQGIPIHAIIVFIERELKKEGLVVRANSMAFSFFISIFPLIIFLFTLLPYLPIEGFVVSLKTTISDIFPNDAASFIITTIDEIILVEREGLLSLGFVLALFFASNGILAMMRGFDKQYDISYKTRNIFQKRGTAIWLTIFMGSLLILFVAIGFFGPGFLNMFLGWAHLDKFEYAAFLFFKWLVLIMLVYTAISTLYHFGPNLKKKLGFFSAGASLASILSLSSSLVFFAFVNNFGTYNKFYGSIGALIIILLWFQINSLILLIGYELNASIAINRDMQEQNEEKTN